jgi:hypothetical protein
MRRLRLTLLLATLLFGTSAFGAIVYNNITTDTGDTLIYTANGFTQIGDQIALAGTQRLATLAEVQFFNDGTNSGTFDATLRLFNVGSPVGSQIGPNFVMTGIAVGAGSTVNVDFTLPSLLVPSSLIFTAAVANASSGVDILGLDMFEPPTIGSSDNTFAIANNGGSFIKTSTPNENVYFQLQAINGTVTTTPEPATFALLSISLLGLLTLSRRLQ